MRNIYSRSLFLCRIGPKGALAILAGVNIQGFIAAVENEDEKFLTTFPGVGKKQPARLF